MIPFDELVLALERSKRRQAGGAVQPVEQGVTSGRAAIRQPASAASADIPVDYLEEE